MSPAPVEARSGIYAPNHWPWDAWEQRVMASRCFSWAVVRTDLPLDAFKFCNFLGLEIIAQEVDLFSRNVWARPWARAASLYRRMNDIEPYAMRVCFDNEPNVRDGRNSLWYAEQWRRYHDAFVACWDFLDHTRRYVLISPALSWNPEKNVQQWWETAYRRNRYARSQAVHAYWWDEASKNSASYGNGLSVSMQEAGAHTFYVLEHANVNIVTSDYEKGLDYARYLRALPSLAACSCYFIAGGTSDWMRYFAKPKMLEGLAEGLGLPTWERR